MSRVKFTKLLRLQIISGHFLSLTFWSLPIKYHIRRLMYHIYGIFSWIERNQIAPCRWTRTWRDWTCGSKWEGPLLFRDYEKDQYPKTVSDQDIELVMWQGGSRKNRKKGLLSGGNEVSLPGSPSQRQDHAPNRSLAVNTKAGGTNPQDHWAINPGKGSIHPDRTDWGNRGSSALFQGRRCLPLFSCPCSRKGIFSPYGTGKKT